MCGADGRHRKGAQIFRLDSLTHSGAADYLYAGHIELLGGNLAEGVSRYADSIAAGNFEVGAFVRDFKADLHLFSKRPELDELTLGLILDESIRRSASLGGKV